MSKGSDVSKHDNRKFHGKPSNTEARNKVKYSLQALAKRDQMRFGKARYGTS